MSRGRSEMKLTPSKINIENEFNPDQMNDENTIGGLVGKIEHHPGSATSVTAGFKYGLPKFQEHFGLWFEGNAIWGNPNNWTGDVSAMIGVNDQYFVGTKIVSNLKTRKTDEITGIVATKFDDNFAYFHANCLEHKLRLGFSTPHVPEFTKVAAEAKIDLKGEGSLTDKTTSEVVLDKSLNDDTRFKMKLDLSKSLLAHFSFIHRINKNLTCTITDSVNPIGFFKNAGKEKYRIGVAFEADF